MFTGAGDLWEAKIAEYQIYYCFSRGNRIRESNEKLLELSKFAGEKDYQWLKALADGWIGETYFFLGEYSKASFYNQRSLELAQEISDNYNIHRALVQLTEESRTLGDARQSLFFTYRNLSLPESYKTFPRQKWRDLNYATEILYRFNFYEAAEAFGTEAADFAQNEVKDDWMLRTSRRNLAMIYGDLKKFPQAYQQIDETLQISRTFTDEALKKRLVANSFQILADLQRQAGNCPEALGNYDQALQIYKEIEFTGFQYESRKGRLQCSIEQRNDPAVKEEFSALLKLFDEDREKITSEAARNIFFDSEQDVYDAAVDYAFSNLKDAEQSFDYAENSRARSLLTLIRGKAVVSQPYALAEIRREIPAEMQMIYYAVLPDKILIWQISETGLTVKAQTIRTEELNNKVEEYSKLLT